MACLGVFMALQTSGQIVFDEGELPEILQKAKQENKMVFMDCYTSWCGPCKKMMKEVFSLEKVGRFMNTRFVCYKKDMEKGDGKELAERYQVEVYPTFLLLNTEGKVIHRLVGGMNSEDFLKNMENGMGEDALGALTLRYESGERNPEFVRLYIEKLSAAYMREEKEKVLHEFWVTLSAEEKCSQANWSFVKRFIHDVKSPEYDYLLSHKDDFDVINGKEEVDAKIFEDLDPLIGNHCNAIIFENRAEDLELFREYRQIVERARIEKQKELLKVMDFTRAYIDNRLDKALKLYGKQYARADVDTRFSATLRLNGMLIHKGNAEQCRKGLKMIAETMVEWKEDNPLYRAIIKGLNNKIVPENVGKN